MPDKRTAPGAPEGAYRRKREAPTIDLTATELARSPVESAPPTADAPGPAEPQKPEPVQEPPSNPPPSPPPEKEPPPAVDEPPPPEEKPSRIASDLPPPEPPPVEPPVPPHHGANWLRVFAAGVAGGIIVVLVLGALWYAGALPAATPQSTDVSAQVAALQKQIQELQNRPASSAAAPAVDTKSIDALTQRVVKIETMIDNLPKSDSSVAERLNATENAMKSLGVALTALNKRSDDTAATAANASTQAEAAQKAVADLRGSVQDVAKDASSAVAPEQLNALQQRIAALEQSVKSAQEEITKTSAAEKAARLALSATSLRSAVMGGAPYSAELAQAKSLGADAKTLASLEPFAASGVPNAASLAQELRAQLPAMLKASGAQAPTGGFLERLQANASKLVRVQPVGAPAGDDPSAVLARIDIAAAHADVPSALADLAKLPEATRAPAQDWIKKAQARQTALAAANSFATDSARSLGQP